MVDLVLVPLLFLGGFIAGFYGAAAGGGGLVIFPLMIFAGLETIVAIGTMKISGILLTLSTSARYLKEKKVELKKGIIFGLVASVGAFIGSNLAITVDEGLLNLMVAIIFAFAALLVLVEEKIDLRKHFKKPKTSTIAIAMFFIGIYGGFFGTGLGTLLLVTLVLSGLSYVRSAGTAGIVGTIMYVVSLFIFASNGFVDYGIGLTVGAGAALGGWIGAGVAVRKGDHYIKALMLLIVAISIIKLVNDTFHII